MAELLIVIAIVALLASIAMTSLGSSRERIALDLAADQAATDIKRLQTWSRSGFGETLDAPSRCYEISFRTDETIAWKQGVLNENTCVATKPILPVATDAKLAVREMKFDNALKNNVTVTVIPPHGTFIFKPDGNLLTLQLGFNPDDAPRTLAIERASGRVEKQ